MEYGSAGGDHETWDTQKFYEVLKALSAEEAKALRERALGGNVLLVTSTATSTLAEHVAA